MMPVSVPSNITELPTHFILAVPGTGKLKFNLKDRCYTFWERHYKITTFFIIYEKERERKV
jgi:hypothetical protein